jgi:hypothetical protein
MSEKKSLDQARLSALARIDRSERMYKLAFFGAAVLETVIIVLILFAADFADRLHLLIVVAALGTYTCTVMGLVVLGTYANRNTQRIIKAIELLSDVKAREKQESKFNP